jgi:hypothetical protein
MKNIAVLTARLDAVASRPEVDKQALASRMLLSELRAMVDIARHIQGGGIIDDVPEALALAAQAAYANAQRRIDEGVTVEAMQILLDAERVERRLTQVARDREQYCEEPARRAKHQAEAEI